MNLIFILYIAPTYLMILYLSILKIEDINRPAGKKAFESMRHFWICIGISFIPIINIISTWQILKTLFRRS